MSGFGETLFGGRPFIRWTLTPFLVLFAVLMPLLIPSWTPLAIAVMAGMELACLAVVAGFWLPPSLGRVAFRILAGTVFVAYAAYFLHETLIAGKPFFDDRAGSSPLKALAGLLCIGLPSLWYALFGRFAFHATAQGGPSGESAVPRLDPERVPPELREFIPLAEQFGITDDVARERFVASCSLDQIAELKAAVAHHDGKMDEWLAGPEADAAAFSAEHLAFSAMRMAADFA